MLVESMYQLDTSGEYVENEETGKYGPRSVTAVTSGPPCASVVRRRRADRVKAVHD